MKDEVKKNGEDIIDVEVKEKEGAFKKFGRKIKRGATWFNKNRHWFGAGAIAACIIYAKGYFRGGKAERQRSEEANKSEQEFLKAMAGASGMTDEQYANAQTIRDICESMEIDPEKLMSIHEQWSQDDWDEFIEEKYGKI
jgi:hypothetical protein